MSEVIGWQATGVTVLVGGSRFARYRVAFLLGAVLAISLPAFIWWIAIQSGLLPPASGSTSLGLVLGIVAAGIIAFEMLLWARKRLRRLRLGSAKRWMFWHVWLGIACLPISVAHSGFRLGGTLPAAVLLLCMSVVVSGIWGLILQQVLPRRLLDEFPDETIETEIDNVISAELDETEQLVESIATSETDPLREFYTLAVVPYLVKGQSSGSPVASAARAAVAFADWEARQPNARDVLRRLREVCDRRRRYDRQARLHWWLHSWLCVHVPLSVALCVLLAVHIITALKYW